MSETVALSTRVDRELSEQLERLAEATGRKKVWLINEALRAYLAAETAFIAAVEEGRADAQAGRVRPFEEYAAELRQRLSPHQGS